MENDKFSKSLESESEVGLKDIEFNRREFLQVTGAGIFVFFTLGQLDGAIQRGRGRDYPSDFNAYLKIGADGRVTCFSGKIEMGQGIITSLAQMLAEELDVSLDAVDMVMGDTSLCPYDGGTTGSRSTKYFGPPLRKAAAQARAVLLQMAAEQLDLPEDQLIVTNGLISERSGTGAISYAQLAGGKRIERFLPDVQIKNHSEHSVSGKATSRSDAIEKVTGQAKFCADIQLPGMLYAKVLRPPAHGAKLKHIDTSAADNIEGVQIIRDGELVAALHTNPQQAENALNKIKAEWEESDLNISNQNIFNELQKPDSFGEIVAEKGDLNSGKTQSDILIESEFYNHYVAHAPMEPHTAVAEASDQKIKLWVSSQTPFRVHDIVAEEFKIPPENVHVITPFVGGGFGGKKAGSFIFEAVRLAQLTKKPVQVALTRKEEFFYDTFRPAAVIKLASGIDKTGKINFWHYDNFYAGSRSSEPIYDIPHYAVLSRRTTE